MKTPAQALADLHAEARSILTDPQRCVEEPSLRDIAWITLQNARRPQFKTGKPVKLNHANPHNTPPEPSAG